MRTCSILPALLLLTIACGPPRLGDDDTTDSNSTTGSTTTDDETATSDTGVPPDESSSGITFYPEEDHTFEPCNTFAQDCPEGEKCVPYASSGGNWDSHKCVPVLGEQGVGESCTYAGAAEATDNCDATSYCWDAMDVDGELVGTCLAFCQGTPDMPECPPMSNCSISGDGTITLCIPTCDPVSQDCDDGLACYWANNDFNCIFTTRDIPVGEPCGFINDCAKGLACLIGEVFPSCEGPSCCGAFCDLGLGDGPCEAALPGTSCVPFFEDGEAPPEYAHVGVCIVPPP